MDTPHNGSFRKGLRASLGIFAAALAYAYARYHVIRDVPLDNFPLFTVNKALALASVIIIGLSFILGPLARFWPAAFAGHLPLRKAFGLLGFGAGAAHAVISLILLSPEYYAKFFAAGGKLSLLGESSLLFGAFSLFVFSAVAISSLPSVAASLTPSGWQTIQRLGYLAYAFVLLHVVIMGWKGWLNPESYAYGFISITLVAALFILLVFVLRGLASAFPRSETRQ